MTAASFVYCFDHDQANGFFFFFFFFFFVVFRVSEQVHVQLLAVEACHQAEIMYGLRAINMYLSERRGSVQVP